MVKKEQQNKLVGRIILANFLEYSLSKFLKYVQTVENQPLYKKLIHEGVIIRRPSSMGNFQSADGVIAVVKKDACLNFSIQYAREEFSVEYSVNSEKLSKMAKLPDEKKGNISSLMHKLMRISTRNRTMHELLKGIIECQRDYFESDNKNEVDLKLKPLQLKTLTEYISDKYTPATGCATGCRENSLGCGFVIDASRISRVSRGVSLVNHEGKTVLLKEFFPTKRDIVKRHIKVIIRKERGEIFNGRIKEPYTDGELQRRLKDEYDLSVSRREIGYCRNAMGILPHSKRINGYGYPPLSVNFSAIYPFTIPAVKNNAPVKPGVYELRLDGNQIDYPKVYYRTFYIGSAKNLKKRLLDHLGSNGKNGGIKEYVKEEKCVFRYVQISEGWSREEKNLYNLFIATFGDSPACNHVSPKTSGG